MNAGDYLAKSQPPQTMRTHGIIAGTVAQLLTAYVLSEGTWKKLQRELGLGEQACRKLVGYIVSLHDIGKLSKDIQNALNGNGKTGRLPRHEKTTAFCLRKIWGDCAAADLYANILGAHHQGKKGDRDALNKKWTQYQQEFEQEMRQYFLKEENLCLPDVETHKSPVEAVLLGLVILSDWISSSESFDEAEKWMKDGSGMSVLQTKVTEFLTNSGLMRQKIDFGTSFCEMWKNIPRTGMRPLQCEAERLFEQTEERISLVLLEAPMGEGKTEAGLFCAIQMMRQWGKNGFYIGLPTAATSNQMVKRMRELLAMHDDTQRIKLLHAMAWMEDETTETQPRIGDSDDAQAAMRWMSPVRRGLLHAYAVGTVDQVMMSVMLIKYGVLRLLGLSGKVLVIDELHAYDMYMQTILETLLQWCRALEIPVVLLSATLPPEKKQQMLSAYGAQGLKQEYPAITAVTESGHTAVCKISQTTCRHEMLFWCLQILGQQEQIVEKAIKLVEHGGCACILMNTVRQAQEIYQILKAHTKEEEILLFHARFPAERRDEIEKECVRLFGKDKTYRPKKAILVATQVVEQSLDLDFDVMLTAVAPIDLLLQRAGRVHRHANTVRPQNLRQPMIYVLTPDGAFSERDANCFVYPECLLQRSISLLAPERTVRIPEDMEELVTAGYDSEHISPKEMEQWMNMQFEQQIERSRGEIMCLNPPDREFQPTIRSYKLKWDDAEQAQYLSAKTRLGEPSERIALVDAALYAEVNTAQKQNICRRALARKVLKQSVSVRSALLRDFWQDDRIIEGTGLLLGVSIYPAEERCYTGTEGQTITFDPELGVLFQKKEEEI